MLIFHEDQEIYTVLLLMLYRLSFTIGAISVAGSKQQLDRYI
ncbi:hypothetical protein [Bartonella sp. AR 15-3]|nr:hypothetical protein [Bartonella sp. AR 15-3]